MADNRIRFKIDSTFSGEGFNKATKAVKTTSDTVKNTAEGVSALASQLGTLGGSVGKVSGGVGKLASAISGGPAALVTAIMTATFAAAKWLTDMHRGLQKARAEHMAFQREMHEGYQNRLKLYAEKAKQAALDALEASIDKGLKAIDTIDRLAASYLKLGQAEDNAAKSARAVKAAEIDVALAYQGNMDSEDDRKRREIQAKLDKEMLAYADALEAAKRAQLNANEHVRNTAEKYNTLLGVIDEMKQAGKDTTKQEEQLQKLSIELSAARKDLEAAENGVKVAELKHTASVYNLENEQTRLEEAIQAREEKERAAAESAQQKANADAEAKRQIAEVTKKGKDEIEAIDAKIAAQKEYIEAIKAAKENLKEGAASEAAHGGDYQYHTDAQGNINDPEDMERAQRYGKRAEREAENQRRHMDSARGKWQRRQDELKRRLERARDPKERDKLQDQIDDLDELLNGSGDADDAQNALDQLEQEKKNLMQSMQTDIADIKQKLTDLGLK